MLCMGSVCLNSVCREVAFRGSILRVLLADADLIADAGTGVCLASANRACLLQLVAGCSLL